MQNRIAELREQAGLTQERLAYSSGLGLRTIQRLEYNEHIPRSDTAKAIADALNKVLPKRQQVTIADLFVLETA